MPIVGHVAGHLARVSLKNLKAKSIGSWIQTRPEPETQMDLLQIIKLISIPRWVKFVSLIISIGFIGFAIYAIFGGPHLADGSVLQAGMGLLGILLPLSIAILLLSFYEAGVQPLKKATEKVLLQLLPDVLSRLQPLNECDAAVQVTPIHAPGHTCRYEIKFSDDAKLHFEVELNVKKITLVFYLGQLNFAEIHNLIAHTLKGAKKEGYETNDIPIRKQWDGVPNHCLVLYKSLPDDFLWNSAEKLYFAQDLQIMINSLMWEAGPYLLGQKEIRDE